jgi:uncharacterized membrane protein
MTKLVVTLHVLAAVFLIGPMAINPMMGMRAIRKHDARGVHEAARSTTLYTLLSLIVAAFGIIAVSVGGKDRHWSFSDAWLTISMTLYVIALALALAVVSPSLTQAGRLLSGTTHAPATPLDPPVENATDTAPITPEPAGTDTATIDVEARRKLDATYGRVAASSGIVALLLVIIVVFMVVKPFR